MSHSDLELIRSTLSEGIASQQSAEELRIAIFGKKGSLTLLMQELRTLADADKKARAQVLNAFKEEITTKLKAYEATTRQQVGPVVDMSVPAQPLPFGRLHPIHAMIEEMVGIFADLSFEVVEGPELVSDEDNFENLNIAKDHPARDSHDSFYITDTMLLRTQTTAQQVLEMRARYLRKDMPIRVVVPGKTYRRESDQTHSAMFHQIDAIMVDTETTFADLRGVLEYFVKRLFGDQVETRFRPHHFPFTEPSAEVDIRFKNAQGTGKHTGWLEMLGCGMIHPNVLKRAGINPKVYRGWAFGTSVERPIMIRKQVPDIRLFTQNDVRFLKQFDAQPPC